jgi:hypothetical protein
MEALSSDEIVFVIRKSDLQSEARERLGRELTEDEIEIAKDGLEWGLLENIDVIYNTIFYEMIPERLEQ